MVTGASPFIVYQSQRFIEGGVMAKAAKQIIPYSELLAKVQGLLACYPEACRNIHIDGIQPYCEQVDGANWRVVNYRRSGDNNDLYECREKIAAEIRHLRECYDVEVES
jgi:hypothetical protein